ncbi:VWA domain-containing protein [Hyphomicrobium sp. LHD-15]|uniref:vWA domain-containing protein n=1 Tax=Hyphomicrobium sp. LHD-15 TaxID=3072142 RepID=UPI00280E91B9|nr:VWA domain-containing protein [Hyphomicrobium sp. LHD-15]MDQ8699734.1 VWA domain-containing protein [Hyphomicrobium sp. LHD-15]
MRFVSRMIAGFCVAPLLACAATAADDVRCLDDAMLVLDASGSMAGTDMNAMRPHIAKVREALAAVVPAVAPKRHLGLMVYGPGSFAKCANITLRLRPGPNSAETIMAEVNGVVPAGQTPLTNSVRKAAEELRFRYKPAVVVLLTDGEETCGEDPCRAARALKAEASALTIHVIGFKVAGAATWLAPGTGSACMAAETGGLAITAHNKDELIDALRKTLTCPLYSEAVR